MDEKKQRNKKLSKIWGLAGRLGWDKNELYRFLFDQGFDCRLSEMNVFQLNALLSKIEARYNQVKNKLDDRGKFMYAIMIKAGWYYKDLNRWMQNRFNINPKYSFTDTWRNLSKTQRSGVIGMLENYKDKRKSNEN